MWSHCRRRPRSPWQSTRGCSIQISLNVSADYSCACRPCAPCQPTSSPSSSSCGWWARRPLRRWFETCSYQGAPSAGPTHRGSEPHWLQSETEGPRSELKEAEVTNIMGFILTQAGIWEFRRSCLCSFSHIIAVKFGGSHQCCFQGNKNL